MTLPTENEPDRQFYAELVQRHSAELYGFAYRLCGAREAAEDLVQETFCEAWRSMAGLRDEQNVRAWLFQILRYRYAHFVRDGKRRTAAQTGVDLNIADSRRPSDDVAETLARRELLQKTLDALDERYRTPLLMVFLEGMTCAEAAGELELPLGTVLSRIHRARQSLRRHLSRFKPDGLTVGHE